MLSVARREHLVLWLENNWARQTVPGRATLLVMNPRIRGLVAGHEALDGLEPDECANAIEVVERFYREKSGSDWKQEEEKKEEFRLL
jgi:hypothetical protein